MFKPIVLFLSILLPPSFSHGFEESEKMLLIVGGVHSGHIQADSELVLFHDGSINTTTNCDATPDDYPIVVEGAVATTVHGFAHALSCGGGGHNADFVTNACYAYNFSTGFWSDAGVAMRESRQFPFGCKIGPADAWLVTGGFDGEQLLDTSEILDGNGVVFEPGPVLPHAVNDHCVVPLSGGRISVARCFTDI
jgi:hypothetical protein